MSRSYQKSPCKSYTNAGSSKAWKAKANQRHRHNQKQLISKFLKSEDWDNYIPRVVKDDSNLYDSPKDGHLHWWFKPMEEDAYNPRTDRYDKKWKFVEEWVKVFRK